MPMPGGGTMYRLLCGTSMIKLVRSRQGATRARRRAASRRTGYRYWTISVATSRASRDDATRRATRSPCTPREIRPGITIAIIEDPDGNWVELLTT